MNITKIVVELIKQYNCEHNRLCRARYAQDKMLDDTEWIEGMERASFTYHIPGGYKEVFSDMRDHFCSIKDGTVAVFGFMTKQQKARAVELAQSGM